MDTLVLTDSQDCPIGYKAKDRKGNPATVQDPVFTSGDESVVTIIDDLANPGGKSAHAVGPLGATSVTFTGDADLGEGVKPIIGSFAVIVNPGEATVIEMTAGTPVEQPA
jgi:hypothetical protein